jgi:hypothetical protein
MVRANVLLATLLAVSAVFVSAAVAAPLPSDQPLQSFDKGIRTTLGADLTMKSDLLLEVLSMPEAGNTRLGFCACGCGIRCETSADCGGAPCRPFITCCVRDTPEQSAGLGKSTRTGEKPAVSVNCKPSN